MLSGKVIDGKSHEALAGATLVLYNGITPSLLGTTIADESGKFYLSLDYNIAVPSRLITRSIGYVPDTILMTPDRIQEPITISLTPSAYALRDIIVTDTRRGIRINGDTIDYMTERFYRDSLEAVGNVLERLPGVDRTESRLKYLGQPIRGVLLDGNDFASNQADRLFESLRGKDIESIQFIPVKDPVLGTTEYDLNLRLEKDKSHQFIGEGEGLVGINTDNRWGHDQKLFGLRTDRKKWLFSAKSGSVGNLNLTPLNFVQVVGLDFYDDGLTIPSIYNPLIPIQKFGHVSVGVNGQIIDAKRWKVRNSIAYVSSGQDTNYGGSLKSGGTTLLDQQASNREFSGYLMAGTKIDFRASDSRRLSINLQAVHTADRSHTLQSFQYPETRVQGTSSSRRNRQFNYGSQVSYISEGSNFSQNFSAKGQLSYFPVRSTNIYDPISNIPALAYSYGSLSSQFSELQSGIRMTLDAEYHVRRIFGSWRIGPYFAGRSDDSNTEFERERYAHFSNNYKARSGQVGGSLAKQINADWSLSALIGLKVLRLRHQDHLTLNESRPVAQIQINGQINLDKFGLKFLKEVAPYNPLLPPGQEQITGPVTIFQDLHDAGGTALGSSVFLGNWSRLIPEKGTTYSVYGVFTWRDQVLALRERQDKILFSRQTLFSSASSIFLQASAHWRRGQHSGRRLRFSTRGMRSQTRIGNEYLGTRDWSFGGLLQEDFIVLGTPGSVRLDVLYEVANFGVNNLRCLLVHEVRKQLKMWELEGRIGILGQSVRDITYAVPIIKFRIAYAIRNSWKLIVRVETYSNNINHTGRQVYYLPNQVQTLTSSLPGPTAFFGVNYSF